MPTQEVPPDSQHCQPSVSLKLSARDGYGSLNRAKITASLPFNAVGPQGPNGTDCAASGIGFWQVACADGQPEEVPVYTPSVQCRYRMATMPLSLSRLT